MPLKIISENDRLLVVDKPAGLTVEQLSNELAYTPAHRLDKDTSGVLLFAKTPEALQQCQQEFKLRQVEKRYICLVQGNIKEGTGVIHTLLARSPADRRKQRTYPFEEQKEGSASRRREALTEWQVLDRFEGYTLLEVIPKTGRKHQIRAHMASISHPIAGDKLYGFKNQQTPNELKRQFLHARSLKILDQEFTSKLPHNLQHVLENLEKQHG
jgi:23S rRNA pseudouridine1911/1915/1917 synthase